MGVHNNVHKQSTVQEFLANKIILYNLTSLDNCKNQVFGKVHGNIALFLTILCVWLKRWVISEFHSPGSYYRTRLGREGKMEEKDNKI